MCFGMRSVVSNLRLLQSSIVYAFKNAAKNIFALLWFWCISLYSSISWCIVHTVLLLGVMMLVFVSRLPFVLAFLYVVIIIIFIATFAVVNASILSINLFDLYDKRPFSGSSDQAVPRSAAFAVIVQYFVLMVAPTLKFIDLTLEIIDLQFNDSDLYPDIIFAIGSRVNGKFLLVLFVIGFYLHSRFSLAYYIALDTQQLTIPSLKKSWAMTQGRVLLFMFWGLVSLVLFIIPGGIFISPPFYQLVYIDLYRKLSKVD